MEEIKEINEDIIRLKEAMNMIRERENSIKEQNEALEDETRIVKAQREEQKISKAEEDLKEFKDQTLEIILRMANRVKELRKIAEMQYIKDRVNAEQAVQERKNLQNKRIKLLNKKNAELNNDKLTETERARKEKFIEAISIKIENEQKEIDGLPNVKKVEENWKKTSDDLNNAEETLNKYRLILLGIRVQTQNEYEQDEPTPNRPVQGEPMPNRPVPGESTPSEPVQDEQEQGEPTPSEPVQDEQAQDEPTQGEPAPNRPVQGEPTPSEPVQDEQEQDEPAQGEPAQDEQDEPTPNRPVQGEPIPNRPVQGEPTPSEPVQDEQEQGEPTPSEPVQDEQAQDEPIEQPELIDKAIIRATEEARRKYMDLIRRAQIGNSRNKQYEKDINLAESRGDHTLAKKIDEERKKFLESYPKEPEIKRAEENLRRNEIKSAIICGVYDEGVKDVIRRGIVLSNKDEVLAERADLEKEALRMLTEEERNDIMGTCNRKGYVGGVNIDLKNNEVSVLVDGLELKTYTYERSDYSPIKRWIEKKDILLVCDRLFGVKMKGREIRNLDEKVFEALGWLASKDPDNLSEEDFPVCTEYFTAYHKSLTDNPDRPRIAIAYSGENIDRKSFNASKRYMRQAQKFGGTIPEGCDVRTPWQKFIDFLKKPKMIEGGDGKGESEQQGEQTDEKTPQGGQAAKDFRDRNHDEKAAATVEETAQQNAQEAQRNAQKAQGTQNRDAEKGK